MFFRFVFLRFLFSHFSSFSSFQENLAHFQAVAVDCPSGFGHGENCKTLQRREFASDPVYTNPVRNFPNPGEVGLNDGSTPRAGNPARQVLI